MARPAHKLHLRADRGEEVGDVLGEHVGVERRLLGHANFLPESAVVRDHALAEDRLQAVEVFDVVVGLGDEHVLEVLRFRQKHDPLRSEIDRDNRSVTLRHGHERAHGILGVALEERSEFEPDAAFLAEALGVGGSMFFGAVRGHSEYLWACLTLGSRSSGRCDQIHEPLKSVGARAHIGSPFIGFEGGSRLSHAELAAAVP